MASWLVSCCVCALLASGSRAVPRAELGELRVLRAPAAYDVDSTVFLNDVARKDKEVGYKIRASLDVLPLWADAPTDFLLKFHLHTPKLYLRGKHVNADFMPYDSVWDSYGDTTFYAHWSRGLIKTAFLDPSELPDVLNYKKSLLSLFQFQVLDGEHNETDVSGSCRVLYETISMHVFRKIKMQCDADAAGAVSSARRVARYTLSDSLDALEALHAEELLVLGHDALGLKARAWHALRRRAAAPAPPAPPAPAASLAAALHALPAALRALPLSLAPADDEPADDQELSVALEHSTAALQGEGAGEGGSAAAAAAALRLLPPLQRANHSTLLHLLQRDDMHHALPGLCRLLGLTATRAAHSAARDFLQLHARDPLEELAHTYLGALALADAPDEWTVLDVLRLGEDGRAPAVRDSALLAAAAAAGTLLHAHEPPAHAPDQLAQTVRDSLARGLARCKDEPCRALRLHALANLRRADTADLLLEHAQRGVRTDRTAALAALDALEALPPHALTFARLDRLAELALDERAPLELRAAALDLVTQRRASLPAPLAGIAHALHERGPHELRRVLWQRMAALAPAHEALRALPAMLQPQLRGWDAQAHAGTSSVLARETGWAAGGWRAQLTSLQLARAGLLRRGTVRLQATDDHQRTFDALTVDIWTRGLEAFGGGEAGEAAAHASSEAGEAAPTEEAAGGLALAVGGARMRDISLFNGQAELLGHVWAGTASSPTGVLRALRPLVATRADVPLLGGVRLRVRWRGVLALALDAAAQASLWWRSARAELELRTGAALLADAELRTAWGRLGAEAESLAEPRLRIAADLDFYDAVALCVRASTEEHSPARRVTLQSEQGVRRMRVRRERRSSVWQAGRTLALGRPNDATCRTLRSADASADQA